MKSYGVCFSPSDLFRLAKYPLGPSMSSEMVQFHFLWPIDIPLYVWYHNFFTPTPVDGHGGRFHFLAAVNGATANMGELRLIHPRYRQSSKPPKSSAGLILFPESIPFTCDLDVIHVCFLILLHFPIFSFFYPVPQNASHHPNERI